MRKGEKGGRGQLEMIVGLGVGILAVGAVGYAVYWRREGEGGLNDRSPL